MSERSSPSTKRRKRTSRHFKSLPSQKCTFTHWDVLVEDERAGAEERTFSIVTLLLGCPILHTLMYKDFEKYEKRYFLCLRASSAAARNPIALSREYIL